MPVILRTAELLTPIAHFSHAVVFDGLVFVGAKGATDPRTTVAGRDRGTSTAASQAERTFQNVATALRLLDTSLQASVQMNVYLTDWRYQAAFDAACGAAFGDSPPAMTVVQCIAFAIPELLLEIEVTAAEPGAPREPVADQDGRVVGLRAGDRFFSVGLLGVAHDSADASVVTQSEHALGRLLAATEAAGLDESALARVTVTLADPRDVPAFLGVWTRTLRAPRPSCSVRCASLPDPRAWVQVDGIADARGAERVPYARAGEHPALAGESAAARAGDLIWSSGLPFGAAEAVVPPADAERATDQALDQTDAALGGFGCTLADALRTYVAVPDWRYYRAMNVAYSNRLTAPYPPRSAIQAIPARLHQPIQLDLVAGVGAAATARILAPPEDAAPLPRAR